MCRVLQTVRMYTAGTLLAPDSEPDKEAQCRGCAGLAGPCGPLDVAGAAGAAGNAPAGMHHDGRGL